MEEGNPELVVGELREKQHVENLVLKINDKKTLRLSEENCEICNYEVQVLYIKENLNFKLLENFKVEKFLNIFVIVVEVKNNLQQNFWTLINQKFSQSRGIFVQEFSTENKSSKFYQKLKSDENFTSLKLEILFLAKCILTKNNFRKHEDFFSAIDEQKVSLIDLDFHKVLKLLKLSIESEKFKPLKEALSDKNEILVRLLNLFVPKITNEIIEKAIETKNSKIIEAILKSFDATEILKALLKSSQKFSLWKEMRKISHDNNFFNSFHKLQKGEEEFFDLLYDEEEKSQNSQDPKTFPKALKEFHENIKSGNLEKIQEFVEKFTDFKFCCDENKICALKKAIDSKKFEIYSFLLAESFLASNQKKIARKIKNLKQKHKNLIRDFNEKFSKSNPENFISILCAKCDISSCSGLISHSEIREMIQDLSKDEDLKPILEFTAETDVKIVFDFKTESVKTLDPNYDEHTMGLAYYWRNLLYVGRDVDKKSRYGTFVHELSHFVFFLLFENKCLPFYESDSACESLWIQIVENEKRKFNENPEIVEPIIRWVFQCYFSNYQHKAELAVRANHVLSRYLNETQKVEELKRIHSELFAFNENFILKFLKLPKVYKTIKLNNDFGLIKEIQDSKLQISESFEPRILNLAGNKIILSSKIPQLIFSQIIQEILQISENHVQLKTQNFFVKSENVENEEFKILMENSSIERIFIEIKNNQKNLTAFLNSKCKQKVFLVCNEEISQVFAQETNLSISSFNFQWNNLSKKSQKYILEREIKFQNISLKFSKFFKLSDKISENIFEILCQSDEIQINCDLSKFSFELFIPQKIEKKKKIIHENFEEKNLDFALEKASNPQNIQNNQSFSDKFEFEEFSLGDFHESVLKDLIVLISDMAGSGKTTFLKKVHQILLTKFPDHWIIFISLKDHIDILSECILETFKDSMIKLLNLDPLEAVIFTQKFAVGEVKILFDAFDEISPKCKEETLNLFKLFKAQEKNQIWITTRTHLENDLESGLKVLAHRLKILDESEQIEFLKEVWKNSNINKNIIENCAKNLIYKISEMISTNLSVIGLPLIIQGLANYFKNEIKESFTKKLEKLKISVVYENLIIKANFKILKYKFPEKIEENLNKSDSILNVHQYLAIVHFFNEELAENLNLNYDEDEWTLEEISRGGIIKYDKDQKVKFNHETYAEYLVATVMIKIIKTSKKPTNLQLAIFQVILISENFQITRMFLDEMLEGFQKNKFLDSFAKSVEVLTFRFIAYEGLFNLFEIIFDQVKVSKVELYKRLFEIEDEKLKKTIFMEILPNSKNAENFQKISGEILDFYGENVFNDFLCRVDDYENTILHLMTADKVITEIFVLFTEIFLKTEKLEKLFFKTNKNQETFLQTCFSNLNKNFEKLSKIFNFVLKKLDRKEIKLNEMKKLIKIRNVADANILHCAVFQDKNCLKLVYNFVLKLFDQKEFHEFIEEVDKNGDTILHFAARFANSKEIFEFLWLNIFKNVECKKEIFMLKGNFDRNVLHNSVLNENDSKMFQFVFNTAKSFCANEEEIKNLILENSSININLLTWAAAFAPKSNLEFLFEKILIFFDENEMKTLLKASKGPNERNVLSLALQNKNKKSIEFLWKFLEKNLSREQILKLFKEKDKNGNNLIQLAAKITESAENFQYLMVKLKKNFNNEFELKNYLKCRGFGRRNILQLAICSKNENSFFFIFENVFCTFFKFEIFIYDCDESGENFLHYLARFGSVLMLEFAFKKLEEKLSQEEFKIFLKIKSKECQNSILDCAELQNSNSDSVEFISEMLEKILGKNKVVEILNERSSKNQTIDIKFTSSCYCFLFCMFLILIILWVLAYFSLVDKF